MDIRSTIREAAERLGYDYKVLAARSALPRATVHRYLAGKLDLTGRRLGQLLESLELVIGRPSKSYQGEVRQIHRKRHLFMKPLTTKAVLRYPGSKWRLMARFVRLMPEHSHYVSVFGGSGADILRKPPSALETFNDLDGRVANFFMVLQSPTSLKELRDRVQYTPSASQAVFGEALSVLKKGGTGVERAWAFLVACHQGYCGSSASSDASWRRSRRPHTLDGGWKAMGDLLEVAAERFRSVQVCQQPWEQVLGWSDSPETLFFVDPPYLVPNAGHYEAGMDETEHGRLLDSLKTVTGKVMLCGYETALYRERLSGWRRVHYRRATSLGAGTDRAVRLETVWMNCGEAGERIG